MTLTVSSALELEIFQRAGARVVAGHEHLARPVRWAHAAEIPDIAKFLSGGEILLTAGLGIGRSEAEQTEFVRSLAAVDAAALVIELSGRVYSEVPPAVVREAELLGLPVISIEETPFVEIAAQVHSALVEGRVAELLEAEATNEAVTELLLSGADYMTIVADLAQRVDQAVVLEDAAHVVMCYSGGSPAADEILSDWSAHSRLSHPMRDDARVADERACLRRPVVLRGEVWGWLHVLHGGSDLPAKNAYAAGRAAAAIAISLLGERISGVRQAQRQGALISRLMLGDVTGEEFIQGALKLGRDMRDREFVVAVAGGEVAGKPFSEPELASALAPTRTPWVAADTGDFALAVIGLRHGEGDRAVADALRLTGARVGISRIVSVGLLDTAVRQARDAYAATSRSSTGDRLVRFDELGVERLLIVLSQGPELANYVEDELGVVLAHDAASGSPLLPTLRVLLESDGRKSEAASRLHVQRRTLYYRIERIEALLGTPLSDSETRYRLLLAVRGLDLLIRRGQQSGYPISPNRH
jgi:purine catabolism regulator